MALLDERAQVFVDQQRAKELARAQADSQRAASGQALGLYPQFQMSDPATRSFVQQGADAVLRRAQRAPAATANAVTAAAAASTDANAGGSIGGGPGASSPLTTTNLGFNGVTKIQGLRGAPVYTNMGQAGYDEIQNMRAPSPTISAALRNVPEMPSVLNPSPAAAAAQPTVFSAGGAPTFIPGDGSTGPTILGGGRGLVSPAAEDQTLSSLDSRIGSLLNSNSIFDAWRARQLGRQRDRYVAGQVAQTGAQTRAFEADTGRMQVNQAPALEAARLRTMQNNAQLEAQSRKYGVDSAAGVRGKELELDAAKARPEIEMGARIKAALDKQDWATFNKLTGKTAKPKETKFEPIPLGAQYGMLTEDGRTRMLNLQEMVKEQAAAVTASQREDEARRRAEMQ